jgi:hypothetical protein
VQVLQRVRAGDLTGRTGLTGRDEVAQLAQALDASTDAIAGMVRQAGDNAHYVAAASEELSSVSVEMSSAAERTSRAWLSAATAERPVLVLIDAVDQLVGEARELAWLPHRLPAHVRLVVSVRDDAPGPADPWAALSQRAASGDVVDAGPYAREDAIAQVDAELRRAGRTLTAGQRAAVVAAIDRCRRPLFPFDIGGQPAVISGSVGIALHQHGDRVPDELVRSADEAMYAAKTSGKNRYAFAAATPA